MTFDVFRPPTAYPDKDWRALIIYLQYIISILDDHEARITTLEP